MYRPPDYRVPYLQGSRIEQEAESLLESWEETTGEPISAPIPIEEIVRYQLSLDFSYGDLQQTFGLPADTEDPVYLGAIFMQAGLVVIDERLDPARFPNQIGRSRFSTGHEAGHWCLHREFVLAHEAQTSLFQNEGGPSILCRETDNSAPIEWQANFFSSCVLMPKSLFIPAFQALVGMRFWQRSAARGHQVLVENCVLESKLQPLAQIFEVSPIAMRIRAEKLGLIREASSQVAMAVQSAIH